MDIKKKRVVVITGATAGVGRAIAKEFAKEGARIGVIARGEKKLTSTVNEIRELGGEAIACSVDVSDEKKLEEAACRIENEFGPIDLWINNAMVTMLGMVDDISSEEIKRVMDVNYLGSVNGILVASRRFKQRSKGHIIQIGSALAYLSIPLQSAYCASKHAIHAFIQSYRIELKVTKSKIHLSEVHLPAVNTPQFEWMRNYMPKHPMPVPPIYEPEVVALAVYYIADHPRREMWVGGPAVKAIVGGKLFSWLAEKKLAKEGVSGQQTDRAPLTHEDNMWKPLERDYGARGIFSDQARNTSLQLWMSMHRLSVGIISIATGAITLFSFKQSTSLRKK